MPGKCTDKWPTGGVYKSETCGPAAKSEKMMGKLMVLFVELDAAPELDCQLESLGVFEAA